ncbi:phosphoribosyltransferase-like protein [Bosea rubneri]|uniref:PRTase-CE domain-containing protein n=1 Tax=Bosea rubneri TaxID=3075434 RepID=A0ABU3SDX5_9HYPH|nr:hypothetical protein [Bosea sp. ZW T0_25]MDU0342988.1 hypothetical protein [Bosea sp. ZW T0_25]
MRIVEPWLEGDQDGYFLELMRQVQWLGRELYSDYEPNRYETFDERFGKWIGNVESESDQKTLFELLDQIFFVGRREFEALCRAAFSGPISRWIVDVETIAIDAQNSAELISAAVESTWFCPVTDSMRINAFLKLNHIEGKQFRPDWRSLQQFGDPNKIRRHMAESGLRRLVLLEDFVGSGTQITPPAEFAAANFPEMQILLCPLVICPKGIEAGEALEQRFDNLTFSPVLRTTEQALVHEKAKAGEKEIFTRVRKIINSNKHRFTNPNRRKPFGFREVGALVVMYSNCPNNTLPIIHNDSKNWKALFPRIRRN